MASITISVRGLAELERKLGWPFLADPGRVKAIDSFVKRGERQGRGLGAKRNTITTERHGLGASLSSTLNYPRRTGSFRQRKIMAAWNSMKGRVINAWKRDIEARWSS